MWAEIVSLVSKVLAPFRPSAGDGGEITLAVTGTAIRFAIPTWMYGRYVEITAWGASVDVLLGGAAVDVVYGQVSTNDAGAITTIATSGRHIVDGTTRHFLMPPRDNPLGLTHLSAEASGAGTMQVSVSSKRIE